MTEIRPYAAPDLPFVRALFQEYVEAERRRAGVLWLPEGFSDTYLPGLVEKVRSQEGLFLIAESDGRPAGFIAALPKKTEPWDRTVGRVVMIMELHVRAEARRQGIGRALFAAAEEHFRRAGFSYVTLGVFASNPAAHAFYRKMGYDPTYAFLGKALGPAP